MKILFTPSDNNLVGAFQSMVRLCVTLKENHGCDILVLLRTKGMGEKLLEENQIDYRRITSFNWVLPDHPTSLFRKVQLFVYTITKPFAQLNNQYAIWKIGKLIKAEHIDIVHLNTTYIYAPAKAAYKREIPVVWHLREFLEEDQHKRIWNRRYGYDLISRAAAVITISDRLFDKYKKLLPGANVLRIYNGIDEKYYADYDHALFQSVKVKLLILGTINESKGQIQAISACRKMIESGVRNIELTIVGALTQYALKLKKQVDKMGLSAYIHFAGLQKNTAPFYRESDIVLICSRFEAFGRVTVEAMMGGCLVIGANTGGTVELIQDGVTGFLYDSGNVDSLVTKIQEAISDRDRAADIAKRGQQYMLENMTAMRNADEIYQVYTDILSKQQMDAEQRIIK